MSVPIDYIDLTKDSPGNKAGGLSNRNCERTTNRNKVRPKHRAMKTQLENSVILEIPDSSTTANANRYEDKTPMEVIDLDETHSSNSHETYCVSDSNQQNVNVLTCPICFEHLTSMLKPVSTRCGHIFCTQCLTQVLRKAKKCPTCKSAIALKTCTRLYF